MQTWKWYTTFFSTHFYCSESVTYCCLICRAARNKLLLCIPTCSFCYFNDMSCMALEAGVGKECYFILGYLWIRSINDFLFVLLNLLEKKKSQTKTKISKQYGFALLKTKQNNPLQVIPYLICLNKICIWLIFSKINFTKFHAVLPFV